MNCPHCGTEIKPPETPRWALRSLQILTCGVCGKQCTPAQAVEFANDPDPSLDPDDKEPWQR